MGLQTTLLLGSELGFDRQRDDKSMAMVDRSSTDCLALVANISCDPPSVSLPQTDLDDNPEDDIKYQVHKVLETGQWIQDVAAESTSENAAASGPGINGSSQAAVEDTEWRPIILTPKPPRKYPASWRSKKAEVYSTPGELIAARPSTNGEPSAQEAAVDSPPTQVHATEGNDVEEAKIKKAWKGKGKAKVHELTEVEDMAEAETEPETEPRVVKKVRSTRKRRRDDVDSDAERVEITTPDPAHRVSTRSRKAHPVETSEVVEDSDAKRPRKKRKVNRRKW